MALDVEAAEAGLDEFGDSGGEGAGGYEVWRPFVGCLGTGFSH